jgi:hypothetical protein
MGKGLTDVIKKRETEENKRKEGKEERGIKNKRKGDTHR